MTNGSISTWTRLLVTRKKIAHLTVPIAMLKLPSTEEEVMGVEKASVRLAGQELAIKLLLRSLTARTMT